MFIGMYRDLMSALSLTSPLKLALGLLIVVTGPASAYVSSI